MQDYTKITLGALLTSPDETVKRNAMSILKRLTYKNYKIVEDGIVCPACGDKISPTRLITKNTVKYVWECDCGFIGKTK